MYPSSNMVSTFPMKYKEIGGGAFTVDGTNKNLAAQLPNQIIPVGTDYILIRVDPLAAAGDGILFTEDGSNPTISTNPRFPLVSGEEYESNIYNFNLLQVTKFGTNNVTLYVSCRQY